MKAKVSISNIWWHEGLCDFFFRGQSYKTLELLMTLSTMSDKETLRALDAATEDMDLDDVEELFYSYSAEDMAREFGIDINENDEEDEE